jgi:PIN domain nuclease of toxin-antitoxin system
VHSSSRSGQKKPDSEADVRLLLDTHAFLWWLDGDRQLSIKARHLIADDANAVLVSAASAWEITTKARIGKLPGALEQATRQAAKVPPRKAPISRRMVRH